jgi:hypothetical protein
MSIKKALNALLEQFTIRNSADVELAVYDSLKATITIKFSSKRDIKLFFFGLFFFVDSFI